MLGEKRKNTRNKLFLVSRTYLISWHVHLRQQCSSDMSRTRYLPVSSKTKHVKTCPSAPYTLITHDTIFLDIYSKYFINNLIIQNILIYIEYIEYEKYAPKEKVQYRLCIDRPIYSLGSYMSFLILGQLKSLNIINMNNSLI